MNNPKFAINDLVTIKYSSAQIVMKVVKCVKENGGYLYKLKPTNLLNPFNLGYYLSMETDGDRTYPENDLIPLGVEIKAK